MIYIYIILGILTITFSILVGFGIGVFSGLYFRNTFKEFCKNQVEETQKVLDEQLMVVQRQAKELVINANYQAQHILQEASQQVLDINIDKSSLN